MQRWDVPTLTLARSGADAAAIVKGDGAVLARIRGPGRRAARPLEQLEGVLPSLGLELHSALLGKHDACRHRPCGGCRCLQAIQGTGAALAFLLGKPELQHPDQVPVGLERDRLLDLFLLYGPAPGS